MGYPYKAQLEVLGVERVKKGMPAFDQVPCMNANTCFLGEADVWRTWYDEWQPAKDGGHPLVVLSCAYELRTNELRQSCVLFLAEHGEAIEPSPLAVKAV
mgnify:CR=1 FL=1